MNKFIFSIVTSLVFIVVETSNVQAAQTDFENALYALKHLGELSHVWEKFQNTQFFVVVIRNDTGVKTKDFRFPVFTNPVDNKPYVLISEHLVRLENAQCVVVK